MASRAEEYRGHANECDQRAATARDSEVRSQFEELARQWREMANQIDRMFSGYNKAVTVLIAGRYSVCLGGSLK